MPRVESRLMWLDAIPARDKLLFELGLRAQPRGHRGKVGARAYQYEGRGTSWLKSQAEGRHELFEAKGFKWVRRRDEAVAPILSLLGTLPAAVAFRLPCG